MALLGGSSRLLTSLILQYCAKFTQRGHRRRESHEKDPRAGDLMRSEKTPTAEALEWQPKARALYFVNFLAPDNWRPARG